MAKRPDGALKWSVTVRYGGEVSSPAIGSDGTVYFMVPQSYRPLLFAFRPDGTTNWVISLGGTTDYAGTAQLSSPVIGPDGTIYVGLARYQALYPNLFAINPDGTTKWTASLRSKTYCSPSVGPEGTVYVGSDDGTMYAFDSAGQKKWEFLAAGFIESSPVLADDGRTILFGSQAGTYALEASGTKKWLALTGGISPSPAVLSDGTILVGSYANNTLFALRPDGSTNWTSTGSGPVFAAPTVGADGTIYVAFGSKLCALYGTNQLLRGTWSIFRHDIKHTGRSIQCALQPPAVLEDGSVALNCRTEPGLTYRAECSMNLLDWAELSEFVSEGVQAQVLDSAATNFAARYYRLNYDGQSN